MAHPRIDRRHFLRATGRFGLAASASAVFGRWGRPGGQSGPSVARWPTHCVDAVPRGPRDYQAAFDYREGGWAGADGAWPITLPDGRVLWLFGDSLMGDIDANNALLPGWRMVISVQVQDGACFTPMTGGTTDDPSSFFPNVDRLLHWPGGGYVDTSVDPPVVRVEASGIVPGTVGEPRANRIFTLSLPELELIGIDSVPYEITVGTPNIGGTLFHDEDTVYLYGSAGSLDPDNPTPGQVERPGLYLARAPADDLLGGRWEYWTGAGWSADIGDAGPMSSDSPEDPRHWATPGSIVRWGDGYLMTGKMGDLWVFDSPIYAWYAEGPSGPWYVVRDDDCEPADIAAGHAGFPQARWHYGGILATDVPGASAEDPMLVFSTNGFVCDDDGDNPCTTDTDVTQNVYLYGPHFLRPTGLPSPSEASALVPTGRRSPRSPSCPAPDRS